MRNLGPGDIIIVDLGKQAQKLCLFSDCTMSFLLGSSQMFTMTTADNSLLCLVRICRRQSS